ncbi:DUF6941 family protein [Mycobacterium paraffinicum]|nr:hypothetical protein [Mycobacterium paraffinicum]MCV7313734.1 hypothetical protein [Mycobacterium paraffinicum]
MTDQPMPTDIHAEAFFTADHAVVENGKLYVNGGFWTRMSFPSFPVVHSFSVGLVLHIPWRAHHQSHSIGVFFEDADGNINARLEGQFETGTSPDMRAGDFTAAPVAMQVGNFVFQRPGDYAAVLHVDGTEIDRWRFRAVQVVGIPTHPTSPPPPAAPPPTPPTAGGGG